MMLKKFNADVWAGIAVLLISLVFLIQSLQYNYSSKLGPGPGFFPLWLSGILFVLALIYIYHSFKGKNVSEESMPTGKALKNILFILGSLILFLICMSFAGFILTGTIFLFLLLYQGYRWYINLAVSLGVSVLLFWLFDSLLGVALPVNGLGW